MIIDFDILTILLGIIFFIILVLFLKAPMGLGTHRC